MSPHEMLIFANRLADAAGEIIRHYFNQPTQTEHKADASPVTRADREAETAMRKLIELHYPDHGIIGEEYGNVRPDAPYQWVLDPIDGTRAFISGFCTFTTLIALAYRDAPMIGIIDQPILRERWSCISGEKTLMNGKPITPRKTEALDKALITTTSTYYFTPEQALVFEHLRQKSAHAQLGGDAYAYAMLASGRVDIVVDAGMKPYDFCALAPIITGAGGSVSDWQGKPLTLTSKGDIVASATSALHQQALSVLQKAV